MIEVKDLKRNFKTRQEKKIFKKKTIEALKGISFSVKEGEIVGYVGPNGSGKSTTIKILSGILVPTSGEVKCMGYIPWKKREEYVAHIGVVLGSKPILNWDLPVKDTLDLMRGIYEIPLKDYKRRLKEYMKALDLEKLADRRVRKLSLGERMKFNFVASLLHDPQIIFLDEPTIGLDAISKEEVRKFIRSVNEKGKTIILTTHDMDDIENLCKRIILLNEGEIVYDGDLSKLKKEHADFKVVKMSIEKFTDRKKFFDLLKKYKPKRGNNIEFRISDTKELNRLLPEVQKHAEISDLQVSEPSLQKIIADIYRGFKNGPKTNK